MGPISAEHRVKSAVQGNIIYLIIQFVCALRPVFVSTKLYYCFILDCFILNLFVLNV